MLILKIIGCVVLALLTTLGAGYAFLYLLSKFLGRVGRRGYLVRTPSPNTSDDRRQEIDATEYSIYSHYLSQISGRVLKRINHVFYVCTQRQNKKCGKPYSETSPKGFVPRQPFPSWRTLSRWHIRNIVGRLKGAVNQGGKEPRLHKLASCAVTRHLPSAYGGGLEIVG
jgi:hypothetical protein